MSHDGGSPKNDNPPPSSSGIFYTRQRNKFTKTRNAASSARFRQNVRRRGGGGKEDDSWFARKSSGWTDDAIRSHLVGGGDRGKQREDGFGMIGDVIQGVGVSTDTISTPSNKKMAPSAAKNDDEKNEIRWKKISRNHRRVVGTKFDWEEDEEMEEDDNFSDRDRNGTDGEKNVVHNRGMIAPPPTLSDIMDEQDEIDFASHTLRVHQQKQQQHVVDGEGDESDPSKQRKRRKNAALEELARITSGYVDDNSRSIVPAGGSVCVMDGSIGYRLLKALGYRSRLGMAIVPHCSSGRRQEQLHSHNQQQLNNALISNEGIGNVANTEDIDETLLLSKALSPRELSKWLSSKGLRAIRLPSIVHDQNADGSVNSTTPSHDHQREHKEQKRKLLLTIPLPKLDRHGIGYDPFANAPEFREFRERRLARARTLGRDRYSITTGDRNASWAGERKKIHNGGDRYFTDNLREDERRALWDNRSRKANLHDEHENDDDCDDADEHRGIQQSHHHYAADRDFSDFVGTKSSSGFALEEDDDADLYNHDDNQINQGDRGRRGGGGGGGEEYTMEVQSPVASDAEDNGEESWGIMPSSSNGKTALGRKRSRRTYIGSDVIDEGVIADAWSAWGTDGIPSGKTDNNQRTRDGKCPLTGFVLGQNSTMSSSNDAQPKRWAGPILPSGYLLKRHVFRAEVIGGGDDKFASELINFDGSDCGLGLNFQCSRQAHQREVPKVHPLSSNKHKMHLTTNASPGIMLSKDGNEMNFHAVRESMKSRFVTSSVGSSHGDTDTQRGSTTAAMVDAANASEKNLDEEEWIRVTISPWIPTRLLCKRWGVPVPTSEGIAVVYLGGAVAGGITTRVRSNEETFFRDMIYDPAFVSQNHRDEDIKDGASLLSSPIDREKIVTTAIDEEAESDDMAGHPLPSRPSEEIFRSIFDADESDMEISSSSCSSSSDFEEDEVAGVVEGRTPNGTGKDVEDGVTLVPAAMITVGTIAKVIDAPSCPPDHQDAASIVASSSSSSSSSSNHQSVEASRRRRRHNNHHRTSRVNDGNRSDNEKKRRRHSRSHHDHHRRERRCSESLDEESRDDYSAKRIAKDKKKHHRSRSRRSTKMR